MITCRHKCLQIIKSNNILKKDTHFFLISNELQDELMKQKEIWKSINSDVFDSFLYAINGETRETF